MNTRRITKLGIVLFPLFLCGCFKKELPVPAHNPGSVLTDTVSMSANYKYQVFFDLKTNRIVSSNAKTIWDLGFEATADGYHVVLNSSKMMLALKTGKTDFASVAYADTAGFGAKETWDSPNGSKDSTAIGDWRTDKKVYIVDRGFDELGKVLGRVKIQITAVTDSGYTIRYGKLTDPEGATLHVTKDSAYNFAFFSFDNGGAVVKVEPPKAEWTIAFTQYTHIFYDPVMPYLVTGCLLNRYQTSAYKDTAATFGTVSYGNMNEAALTTNINTIGYEWKTYTGTTYTTNTKITYVVRDRNGDYFKLHFIDFYNGGGVKGNPKWECQQL